MVDQQLRATVEQVRETLRPFTSIEAILLLDWDPGELAALSSELVTEPRVLLFAFEQLFTRGEPLVTCANFVAGLGLDHG